MDLEDAGSKARYLIRDRDGKFPALLDTVLADAGIKVVLSGIHTPPHELDHGTLGPDLPRGTAEPNPDLEPASSAARCTNSNASTTATGLTRASRTLDPSTRRLPPSLPETR
jgi:hypothetical protein